MKTPEEYAQETINRMNLDPGEFRLALFGIVQAAFQTAIMFPVYKNRELIKGIPDNSLTALETWARFYVRLAS